MAGGLFLLLLPFVLVSGLSEYYLYLAIKILIWALFAVSFNLVLGYGGMMSFGHAAYFGVGAYTCALLLVKASSPWVVAVLSGPVAAALTGLIIGFLSVRIRGVFYFATLTLSFAQLLYILAFKWRSLTFGDDGIQGIPVPEIISPDVSYIRNYFFTLSVVVVCLWVLRKVVCSPFGLVLRTVKDNPDRAAFYGVRVERHRLMAFVISAFFSGIAGVLYSFMETSIAPDILFWGTSGEVILMGLLGGMNLYLGPALGAAIMVMLNTFITSYVEYWGMVLGITLILIVLFFPKGVGGLALEWYRSWRGR